MRRKTNTSTHNSAANVGESVAALRPTMSQARNASTSISARSSRGTNGSVVSRVPQSGASRTADVGVVVADAWQRRGVGALLMRALIARAQARGVTALAMDVLPGNRRVLAMILSHWPDAAVGHSPDGLDIHIALPPARPRETAQPQATAWPPEAVGKQVRPLVAVGR